MRIIYIFQNIVNFSISEKINGTIKKKKLVVDAGVITSLGRNSIKDHTTAMLELIKNSYDAGATLVDVAIVNNSKGSYTIIADNGCGMTKRKILIIIG